MTGGGAGRSPAHPPVPHLSTLDLPVLDSTVLHLPVLHLPVMYQQVMDALQIKVDGTYLDGTYGRGGHARGVLSQLGPGGRLLLMDKDPEAIAHAEAAFGTDPRVVILRGSFAELGAWDATHAGMDGVLFDLGVSSPQLDVAARGFSFAKDGPLDMRMDPTVGESAAQWLARASETEIADVLFTMGEERHSRRIARAIVARRARQPITRSAELAELIAAVAPRSTGPRSTAQRSRAQRSSASIHPATRSFQAIRIHINRELADLETGLAVAVHGLRPHGRLAVISFHSLEDRIVKRFIARHAQAPAGNRRMPAASDFVPTLRGVGGAQRADAAELAGNPRARSAVLRVAEKLAGRDAQAAARQTDTDQTDADQADADRADARSSIQSASSHAFRPTPAWDGS